MKKFLTTIITFIALQTSFAQIPYHDALILKGYMAGGVLTPGDDAEEQKAKSILGHYHYKRDNNSNPFLDPLIARGAGFSANPFSADALSQFPSQLHGLSVPMLADAVTQLLIEHASEEINILFFQRFKELLQNNLEFNTLFVNTAAIVVNTEPYQYAYVLQALKEAFRKDVEQLPVKIGELLELDKYRQLLDRYPEVKAGLLAVSVVSKLATGTSPADVLAYLGQFSGVEGLNKNVYSSVKLAALLSESLRSTAAGQTWVPFADFETHIVRDPVAAKIYLGLIYQQAAGLSFYIGGRTVTVQSQLDIVARDAAMITKLTSTIKTYVSGVESAVAPAIAKLIAIRTAPPDKVTYLDYYSFFDLAITGLQQVFDINPVITTINATANINLHTVDFQKYFRIMRSGNEIYKSVNEKDYSSALVNFAIIYGDVQGDSGSAQVKDIQDRIKAIAAFVKNHDELVKTKLKDVSFDFEQYWKKYMALLAQQPQFLTNQSGYTYQQIRDFISATNIPEPDKTNLLEFIGLLKEEVVAWVHDHNIDAKLELIANADLIKKVIDEKGLVAADNKKLIELLQTALKEYLTKICPDPALQEKLLRYGSFAAAIVQAKSAEEVKNALNAVAAPPGSSVVKAVSSFSVAINGYVGVSYGGELAGAKRPIYGAHVPVGISAGWGTGGKTVGAVSVFIPIVDLGAVATYRYSGGDTLALPAFDFQNILAPGAYLVLGRLFNSPFAVSAGFQYGPSLRKIQTTTSSGSTPATTTAVIETAQWRWNIGLTLDIPLFVIYAKPRKK